MSSPRTLPVDNLRGALWMSANAVCSAATTAALKFVTLELPTAEVAFFRCLFGMIVVLPFIARHGLRVYRTSRPGLHVIRGLCAFMGLNLGIYALSHLPLATAAALVFTRPLFMIILAMVLLGEVVRWRRGLATIVGFLGVVIVLGPVGVTSLPAAAAALTAAAFTAGSLAVVRQQAATDGTATIMAWFATTITVLTAVPAIAVWQTPQSLQTWMWLAAIGLMANIGQYFSIRALAIGEASVMNPIDYSQILITALFGFLFFSEVPKVTTWIGAAVITASTLYIVLRGSRLRKTEA